MAFDGDSPTDQPSAAWRFADEPDAYHDPAALVVRIPRGIRSKRKLLAVLADRLGFPRYFGWNWDAFYDCLTAKLASASGPVVIVHSDLPFGERSELRQTYLAILQDLARHTDLKEPLRVVFAASDESAVRVATSASP